MKTFNSIQFFRTNFYDKHISIHSMQTDCTTTLFNLSQMLLYIQNPSLFPNIYRCFLILTFFSDIICFLLEQIRFLTKLQNRTQYHSWQDNTNTQTSSRVNCSKLDIAFNTLYFINSFITDEFKERNFNVPVKYTKTLH